MTGVADTSPISALLRIGRLSLFTELFDPALIPGEVAAELDEGKHILGEWRSQPDASRLLVRAPENHMLVLQLSATLHRGEAAAIALAAETTDALLVIDDGEGRDVARRLGLQITGTLGLLIAAKRRGILSAVSPIIQDLRRDGALWLDDTIVRYALALAEEDEMV